MKIYVNILLVFLIISCKSDLPVPAKNELQGQKKDILQTLDLENYKDLIRHPVSLEIPSDSTNIPKISFTEPTFKFDTISQGEKVQHDFEFLNIGNKALYILDTKVSCGCTVTDYSEEPILPGKKGTVKVTFDSGDKSGIQEKNIIVITNSYPNESVIGLTGFIKSNK